MWKWVYMCDICFIMQMNQLSIYNRTSSLMFEVLSCYMIWSGQGQTSFLYGSEVIQTYSFLPLLYNITQLEGFPNTNFNPLLLGFRYNFFFFLFF